MCVCVCCTLHHGVGVAVTSVGGNGGLHYLPLAVEALHTQVDLVTQTGVAQQQLMGVLVEELAARGLLQHLLVVCLHQHNNPFINAGDTQVLSKIVSDYGKIWQHSAVFFLLSASPPLNGVTECLTTQRQYTHTHTHKPRRRMRAKTMRRRKNKQMYTFRACTNNRKFRNQERSKGPSNWNDPVRNHMNDSRHWHALWYGTG